MRFPFLRRLRAALPTVARRSRPRLELLEGRDLPSTFVVTNTSDSAAPGSGSLRHAILDSNANPPASGANLIQFNIPGSGPQTITPAPALPTVTAPAFIDGATQPGFLAANAPQVVLDGVALGPGVFNGLALSAPGCTVRGLVIDDFSGDGVLLLADRESVVNCFIGIDATGTVARGNGTGGLGNGVGTQAGTPTAADFIQADIISGNLFNGVLLDAGATGAVVSNNLIGTDFTGTRAVGNGNGVRIQATSGNAVGSNVLSGNAVFGAAVDAGGAQDNVLANNLIGTDATGANALPNGLGGVEIDSASRNTVGDNVVSGNAGDGVRVEGGNADGNLVLDNLIGTNLLGNMALGNGGVGVGVELSVTNTVIMGNTVSGSGGDGIFLQGATLAGVTGTVVAGDRVGTDASGTRALPNRGAAGVEVDQAAETTLDSDLIAGNAADGVLLHGAGTTGVAVRRSYIGLTVNGAALPNGLHGVEVSQGAADNTVSGNLVWFNGGHGVVLHDSGTTGNAVTGNTIAFNLGSGVIAAAGAADNAVGGTQAGQGNVITANLQAGVRVDGAATTGIVVEGNSIWGNAGAVAWGNPTLGLPGPGGIVLTAGGNDGQPAPVLGGAAAAGSAGTAVAGGLRAAPTTTYRVEFFDNPDGGDQGQTFLGFLGVTTDAQGNATFTDQFAGDLTALTATATGPNGNTSMFSAPVAVARL